MTTEHVDFSELWATERALLPLGAVAAPWLGENCYIDHAGRMHGAAEALKRARERYLSDTPEGRRLRAEADSERALPDDELMALLQDRRQRMVERMHDWERDTGIRLGMGSW